MKIKLSNVTLLGIDCVNVERLISAMDVSQKDIEFGAVKLLTSLPSNYVRKVDIPHISSIEEFSRFCINDLYKYVDTDYVLLVQYDGFVLNPESWDDEYLKYDYIGAPLSGISWRQNNQLPYVVGNGGFCLRSKKFLEKSHQLFTDGHIANFHPEDVALCVWYRDLFEKDDLKFAPPELAMGFSVQEDYGSYDKPFGFHGLYDKNMDTLINRYPDFPLYFFLSRRRGKLLEKITKIFKDVAIEGHLFGSIAENRSDNFSDIDVWITFGNETFKSLSEKRFELYSQIGDVLHICEPPQNAPINGIFSSVLYKTKVGLIMVDYYLCPESNSFITKESKKLFGDINLSIGETGLNPQKISVPETYRIDFFICFIFNSIKKIIRKNDNPLEALFREYDNLNTKYGFELEPIINMGSTFTNLEKVIGNIRNFANEKQNIALFEISKFINQVKNK
jgi:predicted nucleotidyltransferase